MQRGVFLGIVMFRVNISFFLLRPLISAKKHFEDICFDFPLM